MFNEKSKRKKRTIFRNRKKRKPSNDFLNWSKRKKRKGINQISDLAYRVNNSGPYLK